MGSGACGGERGETRRERYRPRDGQAVQEPQAPQRGVPRAGGTAKVGGLLPVGGHIGRFAAPRNNHVSES
jgi:hypothetical protein